MSELNLRLQFKGLFSPRVRFDACLASQSLLALNALFEICAKALYGREVEVRLDAAPGTCRDQYELKLQAWAQDDFSEHADPCAPAVKIYALLSEVVKLARSKPLGPDKAGACKSTGEVPGGAERLSQAACKVYRHPAAAYELSRLTQILELEGVSEISLRPVCPWAADLNGETRGKGKAETEAEFKLEEAAQTMPQGFCKLKPLLIVKDERRWFKAGDEGLVLADDKSAVCLEVIRARTDGSREGWRFSDGALEFEAGVFDEDFLEALKSRQISFGCGTRLYAIMRTVQRLKGGALSAKRRLARVEEMFDTDGAIGYPPQAAGKR